MLIDEAAGVVDLVVDDHVQVLLGVVARDLLEGEFLVGRHDGGNLWSNSEEDQPGGLERV